MALIDGNIGVSKEVKRQLDNNNLISNRKRKGKLKIIITNYSDSTTYKVNGSSSSVLVNKDKLLQSDGITPITKIASATNIYFLTDEQLKNKDYIQQNTTFPIYG